MAAARSVEKKMHRGVANDVEQNVPGGEVNVFPGRKRSACM
jgi:hypothetical protein